MRLEAMITRMRKRGLRRKRRKSRVLKQRLRAVGWLKLRRPLMCQARYRRSILVLLLPRRREQRPEASWGRGACWTLTSNPLKFIL